MMMLNKSVSSLKDAYLNVATLHYNNYIELFNKMLLAAANYFEIKSNYIVIELTYNQQANTACTSPQMTCHQTDVLQNNNNNIIIITINGKFNLLWKGAIMGMDNTHDRMRNSPRDQQYLAGQFKFTSIVA